MSDLHRRLDRIRSKLGLDDTLHIEIVRFASDPPLGTYEGSPGVFISYVKEGAENDWAR